MIIADGVWWRRALEPDFDPKAVLPIFMDITRHMLRGRPKGVVDGNKRRAAPPPRHGCPRTRRAPDESEAASPPSAWSPPPRSGSRPAISCRTRARKAAPPFAPAKARPRSRSASPSSDTRVVAHSRKLVLSGRTEADKRGRWSRRAPAASLTELRVRRGTWVQEGRHHRRALRRGARGAGGAGAVRCVTQRRTELDAKRQLIVNGTLPKLELVNLEAQLKAAEAALAARRGRARPRRRARAVVGRRARRCRSRSGRRRSRWPAARSRTIVALDPMLAVVEVAERRLAGIKVGDPAEVRLVTGESASGKIRFVAKTASQATRTYRVEVELPNADGTIPDGITAEVSMPLAPVPATRMPRSALTFSSAGDIGVRTVGADDIVGFVAGQRGRGRAELHVGRRHPRRRARDRAGPGFRARRPEGRGR